MYTVLDMVLRRIQYVIHESYPPTISVIMGKGDTMIIHRLS